MNTVGRLAAAIAADVRAGAITARQVVEHHVQHVAAVADRLGALASFDADHALAQADAIDEDSERRNGPLAGVPVVVSDTLDVAGLPTRFGSSASTTQPKAHDAPVVAELKRAGAVIFGKGRVSELGVWGTSDDPEGVAVSPWDPSRSAGGASGGAAAAVGAGLAPLGIGADTNGSVRGPAAACGIVGLRLLAAQSPDTAVGVLATSVADAQLVASVFGQVGPEDAVQSAALRVAVSWKPPAPGVVVSSAWREAALEAGRLLHRDGDIVAHIDPPYDRGAVQAGVARWTSAARDLFNQTELDEDELQGRTRAHIAAGDRLTRVSRSGNDAEKWQEKIAAFFDENDLVVTPAFARSQPAASQWHTRPWAANIAAELSAYPFFSVWEDLDDVTSVVVPLWNDGGRPLAVQLISRGDTALTVAQRLATTVPWARHAPGWGVDS